jgi:hypothetical protein
MDEANGLLPDDKLTIFCEVSDDMVKQFAFYCIHMLIACLITYTVVT